MDHEKHKYRRMNTDMFRRLIHRVRRTWSYSKYSWMEKANPIREMDQQINLQRVQPMKFNMDDK